MLTCLARTALAILFLFGLVEPAFARGRVALVIANARYQSVPVLRNPPADGALVVKALRDSGFDSVEMISDVSKGAMENALRSFSQKADGADVALIYYAGHGIEVQKRNYLIPTDARLLRDRDANLEAISVDTVMDVTAGARMRIVVLDACRENPFATSMSRTGGSRSVTRGLAREEPPSDMLLLFAAKEGAVAADGDAANSPFAQAFARRVTEPGLEISLMVRVIRDDVLKATGAQQEPFSYGSLSGAAFYFVPPRTTASPVAASLDAGLLEPLIWQGALKADRPDAYEDYLTRFPKGAFAVTARANLARLRLALVPGNVMAMTSLQVFELARKYQLGLGFPVNYGLALELWRRAAELGEPDAMNNVAWFLEKGWGTQADPVAALEWYRRGVDAGSVLAKANLGRHYYNGDIVPQDYAKALELYIAAAAQGDRASLNTLGWMYANGQGVPRDLDKAVASFRRAIEGGNDTALVNLGNLYHNGQGVPKDDKQAFTLFKRAADAGNAAGMANVGWFYLNRWAGLNNDAEAVRWSRLAVDKGSGSAMANLGYLYENGQGVTKDLEEAVRLYQRAAAAGIQVAKEALKRLGR